MLEVSPSPADDSKTIIITSSGGSGHLQAAAFKKAQIKRACQSQIQALQAQLHICQKKIQSLKQDALEDCDNSILKDLLKKHETITRSIEQQQKQLAQETPQYDLLLEWAPLGQAGVKWNDGYAREGKIKQQMRLVKMQKAANILYAPSVYANLVSILKDSNIEHVIDTQPLCTKTICKAVRRVNKLNHAEILAGTKKTIRITKVMTDLPTAHATHFFESIRTLSLKDKKLITLETTEPLLDLPNGILESSLDANTLQTHQQLFWEKHLGPLEGLNIEYVPFPIRQGFYDESLTNRECIQKVGLFLRANNQDEIVFLKRLVAKGIAQWAYGPNGEAIGVRAMADKNTQVMSLMLGSTGGVATFDYIDAIIKLSKMHLPKDKTYMFFLFCGRHKSQGDLYDQITEYISGLESKDLIPHQLQIVALGGQNDTEIAPIYTRSDTIIFRSGGLSSMEVLTIAHHQQLLIHSQACGIPFNQKDWHSFLESGMVTWEGGNAKYLCVKKGAQLINLDRFMRMPLFFIQQPEDHLDTLLKIQENKSSDKNLDKAALDHSPSLIFSKHEEDKSLDVLDLNTLEEMKSPSFNQNR